MWTLELRTSLSPEEMAKACRTIASLDMWHCPVTGDFIHCPFNGAWCKDVTTEMWKEIMVDDDEVE